MIGAFPIELWILIINEIEDVKLLWNLRSLHSTLRPLILAQLYAQVFKNLDKKFDLKMTISSCHSPSEFEMLEFSPNAAIIRHSTVSQFLSFSDQTSLPISASKQRAQIFIQNQEWKIGRPLPPIPLLPVPPAEKSLGRGCKGLSRCLAQCCSKLFAINTSISSRNTSILPTNLDSPTSPVDLSHAEISDFSTSDDTSSNNHHSLSSDIQSLVQEQLTLVLNHLQQTHISIAQEMPRGTLSAYSSIFQRLYSSFSQFSPDSLHPQKLLPFLMSVWQLLDIITPSHLRDAHFCSREYCCSGEILVKLFSSVSKRIILEADTEQDFCKFPNLESQQHNRREGNLEESLNWEHGWSEAQKNEFWFERSECLLDSGISFEGLWLKGTDIQTGSVIPARLLSSKLHVNPVWFIRNWDELQPSR